MDFSDHHVSTVSTVAHGSRESSRLKQGGIGQIGRCTPQVGEHVIQGSAHSPRDNALLIYTQLGCI